MFNENTASGAFLVVVALLSPVWITAILFLILFRIGLAFRKSLMK